MRRSTRGILLMDLALALSYDPATELTCGLLLGCSARQQSFVIDELKRLGALACHPLLLPVLITGHSCSLISRLGQQLWRSLLTVETSSGQTGAPVMDADMFFSESNDYDELIKGALEVIQLSTAWESHTQILLLGAETIQESINHLNSLSNNHEIRYVEDTSAALTERLTLISHQAKAMLFDLQYIYKRGQAQMTAIYNYIAKKDVKLSHELTAASHQIAAASKRDSSAMKAIALLTMVFLPGTFTATLFSMPYFEFSSSDNTLTLKPEFWIYWALTIPLTFMVLAVYSAYLVWIHHKHQIEDVAELNSLDRLPQRTTSSRRGNTSRKLDTANYNYQDPGPSVQHRYYSTVAKGPRLRHKGDT